MFSSQFIQQLKQGSISTNEELSKERSRGLWSGSLRTQKAEVEELTGYARNSIMRSKDTGKVSARIVIAFAQVFGVDPLYLTGEAEEKGEYSEARVRELLMRHGYEKLLDEYDGNKPKRGRKRKEETAADETVETVETEPVESQPETVDENESVVPELEPEITEEIVDDPEPEKTPEIREQVSPAVPVTDNAFLGTFSEDEILMLIRSVKLRAKAGSKFAQKQEANLIAALVQE